MKAGEGTEGSISSLSGLWSEKAVPPLTELVDTEERYLAKLADLHLHFSQRLHAEIAVHGQRKTQVTDKDVEFWFQLLPVFQTHHQDLILLLKKEGIPGLGTGFTQLRLSCMEAYGRYAANFQHVSDEIRRLRGDNEWFSAFVRVSEIVAGETLLSLRIGPVQRVPRYRLMLNTLLEGLPDSMRDERRSIKVALDSITQICHHVDVSASRAEHGLLVRRIEQDLFKGQISLRSALSRQFIHQGPLNKSSRHLVNRWKTYTFMLFSDCLIYADLGASPDRKLKHVLDVRNMRIVDLPDNKHRGIVHAFQVVSSTKSITVMAATEEEKRLWCNLLFDQIDMAVCVSNSKRPRKNPGLESTIKTVKTASFATRTLTRMLPASMLRSTLQTARL
ncbi:hypothetical protein PBRA_001673 [Plasmodiophora brassicae]|uniref:DH domain-containing protein n=1 Tax=Plasmodiophora brassicae TaxID=37360 RepID=A0A0G4IZW8_PLABS|nr:hypothetical protein PBRA_001673 [Plasmodiophora brassicae]